MECINCSIGIFLRYLNFEIVFMPVTGNFYNIERCIGRKLEYKKGIKITTVNMLVYVSPTQPPRFTLFIYSSEYTVHAILFWIVA